MPNLMQKAMATLQAQVITHMSVDIVVCFGVHEIPVKAVPGTHELQQLDDQQRIVRVEKRDWIITTTDLVVDGEKQDPKEGWQIKWAVDGEVRVYEAYSPNGSTQPFRYTDPYNTAVRIHTEFNGIEE